MSAIAREHIGTLTRKVSVSGGRYRRSMMILQMMLADICGFASAAIAVLLLNRLLHLFTFKAGDAKYLVVPVLCTVLFMSSKLYPGVGINPAEEIKLVTKYVTLAFAGGWLLLRLALNGWEPNHLALPLMWAGAILCILLWRWGTRIVAAQIGLWGEPVVVIGRGPGVDRTIRYFAERRRLGYIPVMAAIEQSKSKSPTWPVPVIALSTLLESPSDLFAKGGIQTAVVDVPAISEFLRSEEAKELFRLFRRVILVMDLDWIDGASMRIKDYEGVIGIAAEKSVLTPQAAFLKRALDIVLGLAAGVLASPLMLAAAVWIKVDSPGGVLYRQERLGMNGEPIRIYKFRTMFRDAESALAAYLRKNPKRRREWEATQKLCDDPRITRAGKFLRKFSIDELPQILNVLKGEMSLVGPRPIVRAEAHHYDGNMEVYESTRPGMTGLWQVSGRSRTSYEERVRYDTYYVRNWSVWLDLYVMLRTVWVVVHKDGAY